MMLSRKKLTGLFHSLGANVKRAKVYEFYKLGALQALRELQAEKLEGVDLGKFKCEQIWTALYPTLLLIGEFISNPENDILPGALQVAKELQTALSDIMGKTGMGGSGHLVFGELSNSQSALSKFENLLEYDLKRYPTFSVDKIGIFDSDDLIAHAENHLSETARQNIAAKAKNDFQASGRCLAFGEFTAAGFHAVRALESVARKYHRLVLALDAETEDMPLGPVVNDLREVLKKEEGVKASDSPLGLIIANLARMNNIYRKPITHPEMTLDSPDAAKEVFDLAAVSISLLEKDYAKRSAGSAL
jgi:hypothetical protein